MRTLACVAAVFALVLGEAPPDTALAIFAPGARVLLDAHNCYPYDGKWADRIGDKYILHDGFLTNCKVPHPWWRLKGPRFAAPSRNRARQFGRG